MKKVPAPIVIIPDNCIQGCHGCGNLCGTGTIEYVGDNEGINGKCGCSCEDDKGGCC